MSRIEELEKLVLELEANINLKADFIEATINQLAELDQEVYELKAKLNRCFKGETIEVRNELILEAMKEQTDRLLALPAEELRKYLDDKTRG